MVLKSDESTGEQHYVARRVNVDGMVTGVGFRFFVQRVVAEIGDITGYVRNASASRVECLLQGPQNKVEQAVARIEQGPSAARVERCTQEEVTPNTRHDRFSIVP